MNKINDFKNQCEKSIYEYINESENLIILQNKNLLKHFNLEYFQKNEENEIINDLKILEDSKKQNLNINSRVIFDQNNLTIRLYITEDLQKELSLSKIIVIIESFQIQISKIYNYENIENNNTIITIYDFKIENNNFSILKDDIKKQNNFLELFIHVCKNQSVNSISNYLSFQFGLNKRDIQFMNSIFAYSKQIYSLFDNDFLKKLIYKYSEIFNLFIILFNLRLNKNEYSLLKISENKKEIAEKIEKINDITEYNLIKKLYEILCSISRTNFFQKDKNNEYKEWISIKVKSSLINDIKNNGIFAEIFVFHENIEGVHLRSAPIARGGFRWSDRINDYRTEVFDLMKAQIKKNSIIIPSGAKACFIIKNLKNPTKDMVSGLYKIFIQGILDITDNIDEKNHLIREQNIIIPADMPLEIMNQEKIDNYLVAAADKGTATFSDLANEMSILNSYWLDDAFASGGSNGYDHKKLAITSRGMWISAQKLFAEINKDITKESINVIGIGDMSGDVFGNGMLLSKKIKLIAAFNHNHIFIDPNPDEEISYNERLRLFKIPYSTWDDYDRSKISKDGFIFKRSEKTIEINQTIAKLLGIENNNHILTPNELIKYILKSKADLLFNGGIGTFIKSSLENNSDAEDRTNDQIRINGMDLRVLVVAEGGNLGFTQKGRIEYAKFGGRSLAGFQKNIAKINTDFIDNSAGVSCSDKEVNIKIVLKIAIANKKITLNERNELLKSMENEVCELVLKDNILQNNLLMMEEYRAERNISWHIYLINKLEKEGLLNREFENIQSEKDLMILYNSKGSLTRPELCILVSYAKIWLKNKILQSIIPDNKYFEKFLIGYFPSIMQEKFKQEIINHPLKREIITNYIANTIINRMGITFLFSLMEKASFNFNDIIYSYFIVRDSYNIREIWHNIEYKYQFQNNLSKIITFLEIKKYTNYIISRLLKLKNINFSQIEENVNLFKDKINFSIENFEKLASKKNLNYFNKKCEIYKKNINQQEIYTLLAKISGIIFVPFITKLSNEKNIDFEILMSLYFLIEEKLETRQLRKHISNITLSSNNLYDEISISILLEDISLYQNNILRYLINKLNIQENKKDKKLYEKILSSWEKEFEITLKSYNEIKGIIMQNNIFQYSHLILLINKLQNLYNN